MSSDPDWITAHPGKLAGPFTIEPAKRRSIEFSADRPFGRNPRPQIRPATLPRQRPQSSDGRHRALEYGLLGALRPGAARYREAYRRRSVAIPVALGLGTYQPDRRLCVVAKPGPGRRAVQAATNTRKALA